jgi:MerR family mercuric resistance operon transcriptional regulator
MNHMKIGQIARAAGASIETIRYYEREGLIEHPARSPAGYRQYRPEVVERLRFIRQAKELGFSLNEVRELLSLRMRPDTTCADIRKRAQEKIASVDRKIGELQRIGRALERLAAACRGTGPTSECPILEALETQELAR